MILGYETRANQMQAAGETGEARRMARRATALNGLLVHGPDLAQMVAETELPEGYVGKILSVFVYLIESRPRTRQPNLQVHGAT